MDLIIQITHYWTIKSLVALVFAEELKYIETKSKFFVSETEPLKLKSLINMTNGWAFQLKVPHENSA